jgi:hypothetical protein
MSRPKSGKALTPAEKQKRYRERQEAKRRAAPQFVDPQFGPCLRLEEAMADCADLPWLHGEATAQAAADEAKAEGDEVVDLD